MKRKSISGLISDLVIWAFIIYLLTALKKKEQEHGSAAPSEEGKTVNNAEQD